MPELAPVSRSLRGSAEAMEQGQRTNAGRTAGCRDDSTEDNFYRREIASMAITQHKRKIAFKTISNPARQINHE